MARPAFSPTPRQLEILHDLLTERIELVEEDLELYESDPQALLAEAGDGFSIDDYEHYLDELRTFLDALPDA